MIAKRPARVQCAIIRFADLKFLSSGNQTHILIILDKTVLHITKRVIESMLKAVIERVSQ